MKYEGKSSSLATITRNLASNAQVAHNRSTAFRRSRPIGIQLEGEHEATYLELHRRKFGGKQNPPAPSDFGGLDPYGLLSSVVARCAKGTQAEVQEATQETISEDREEERRADQREESTSESTQAS